MSIYKYLAPDRIDVLRNARIRFTQPNALNDPFELKPFFKTIFNMETFRDKVRKKMDFRPVLLKKHEEMPDEIRKQFTPDQFVQLALDHMDQHKDIYDALFEKNIGEISELMPQMSEKIRSTMHRGFSSGIGILSLSEDPANDLMWAHYGGDHSGYVIEFDESNEFFHRQRSDKDEFFRLRKVDYIDKRLNFESLEQLIENDCELFTIKLNSWAYEREWRILAPLFDRKPEIDAAEPIHLFPFPKNAVKAVIFGNKSCDAFRRDVSELLDNDPVYSSVRKLVTAIDLEQGCITIYPFA